MFQLATREWNLLEKNPLARITKFSDPARNCGYQVSIFTPEELHSYCSYSVVLHGFVWTAGQADHSEAMLEKHYREGVTKEGAEKYSWGQGCRGTEAEPERIDALILGFQRRRRAGRRRIEANEASAPPLPSTTSKREALIASTSQPRSKVLRISA